MNLPVGDAFHLAKTHPEGSLQGVIDAVQCRAGGPQRLELVFFPSGLRDDDIGLGASFVNEFHLTGAFLPADAAGGGFFLGMPSSREIRNMTALGLTVADFGPIDPTPEFAMMAEVNASMLADSQMMNGQLRQSHDEALAAKRELEQHRVHLEELVEERTATVARQTIELEEALCQEKRLNELQRSFVSMASHEFRTPLAIIDGCAHRIQRRFERMSPEDIQFRIKKVRFAVKRMTALMESTLAAARMEAGEIQTSPTLANVRQLVQECCEMQQETSSGYHIQVEAGDLPDQITTDEACVTQIITNLLSNAVKYSPGADRDDVRGWRDGAGVALSVRDYGLGIDDDEHTKIFTRFFRARTGIGIPGTGIGLNFSQSLARELGGDITLSSTVGEGSTFTVHLPLITPTAGPDAASA